MGQIPVVEDDKTIGSALGELLRGQGHHVVWEHAGRGALAAAAESRAQLPV